MAILNSNGILEVDSIPTHTPVQGQATLARLTNTNTFYYWDDPSWVTLIIGDDTAYDSTSWNSNLNVPTKNAIRDIIEALVVGAVPDGDYGHITVSGSGTTWTVDNNLPATVMADGSVSNTEFQYLNGATSNIQDQLDLKAIDTEVIHDTGNESVAGVKTFTDGIETLDDPYDATSWDGNEEVPTKNAIRDKIETISAVSPSLLYEAVITQTGTDVPTAVVLINTLGEVPTFARTDVGDYELNTVGTVFTNNKTFVIHALGANATAVTAVEMRAYPSTTDTIIFTATDEALTPIDIGGSFQLSIRVYP